MVTFTQLPSPSSTTVGGTAGADVLSGLSGNDTLLGKEGQDGFFEGVSVWGGGAAPGLETGQTYDFGLGNDVLDGGPVVTFCRLPDRFGPQCWTLALER